MSKEQFIYGKHPVLDLVRQRPGDIRCLYLLSSRESRGGADDLASEARTLGVDTKQVSKKEIIRLVGNVVHQGVVASIRPFAYSELAEVLDAIEARQGDGLVLVLDQVQDPHNVGAITRSALALGADAVILGKDRSCEVTPVVTKASAGATNNLPIVKVTNIRRCLEDLKKRGFWAVGTVAGGGQDISAIDLNMPIALVIGSEGSGMRQKIREACDFLAEIPMTGQIGSLNASVAGSICLYEAARQRRERAGQ